MENIVGAKSVQGASHIRRNLENQDSVYTIQRDGVTILCVADGHGSEKFLRSAKGSDYATKILAELLHKLVSEFFDNKITISDKQESKKQKTAYKNTTLINSLFDEFKENVVKSWKKIVSDNLKDFPLKFHSQSKYEVSSTTNSLEQHQYSYIVDDTTIKEVTHKTVRSLLKNPIKAYGSTLLGVAIHQDGVISFQLGDGDIRFTYSEQNIISPTPDREELFGNETYSLCDDNPSLNIDMAFHERIPKIITVSTDGISGSFTDSDTFDLTGQALYKEYQENSEDFELSLENFLNRVSTKGSGDDCSIAYFFNFNYEEIVNFPIKENLSLTDREDDIAKYNSDPIKEKNIESNDETTSTSNGKNDE